MSAELTNASAVIIAHDVNVSILKLPWLEKHGILTREDLTGEVVVTTGFTRVSGDNFEFLALPDRIQMRVQDSDHAQADILRVLGGIVSTLPHTPVTALGMNFDYVVRTEPDGNFAEWNRIRFASPCDLVVARQSGVEARFGTFVSFVVHDMLLKADIKPCKVKTENDKNNEPQEIEGMQVKCNFQADFHESPATPEILKRLAAWDDLERFSADFVTDIENGMPKQA